jgi:Zinc carboxypeptidase
MERTLRPPDSLAPANGGLSTRAKTAAATALALVGGGLLIASPAVDADPQPTFKAGKAVARNCFAKPAGAVPGVASRTVESTETGLVRVRLTGGGDWDVAVFDQATGRAVAGSSGFRSDELAEGFVTKGQKLVVQGCRYAGDAKTVNYGIGFVGVSTTPVAGTTQVVQVRTADRAAKRRLQALDLDLTEAATATTMEVVLHGQADVDKVRKAGFTYTVKIPDLRKRIAENRAADATFAKKAAPSKLPSGRTTYRRLADYQYEMKELARTNPWLAKQITLSEKTVDGRSIDGLEVTSNVKNLNDGKPVFFMMGVHHAREWPSGEHTLEWAYDLVKNYKQNRRTSRLVDTTRTIVVPLVNPDGFTVSREAVPLGDFSKFDYEMKRKNCQTLDAPPEDRVGVCANNTGGRTRGVDLNRNYGGFWGGPGASTGQASDTYRGSAPFSEPEVKAVRALIQRRQVTNLITNHTYSNLVLRAPSILDTRPPLDEPLAKALGAKMASHNGYENQAGWQLYDTSGSTEDWSFWVTGGLAYTFEIGPTEFHPPFETGVVNEYLGIGGAAGAGKGGNREAYYAMAESTANAAHHATVTGSAPKDWKLRVRKEFQTPTSPVIAPDGTVGDPILYTDVLTTTLKAPGGRFSWALNPSTRPYVAGRFGRKPVAKPQDPFAFANPDGQPAENTEANPLDGPHESIPFTIKGQPEVDNGKANVHIEWSNAENDWDLYIVNSANQIVGQSATFGDTTEDAALIDPLPGEYRAIVVNYDQVDGAPYDDWSNGKVTFENPVPPLIGVKESWTLTCEKPNGKLVSVRQVIVDRGQSVDLGNACAKPARKQRATR